MVDHVEIAQDQGSGLVLVEKQVSNSSVYTTDTIFYLRFNIVFDVILKPSLTGFL